jgi:hypothetical protein
MPPAGARTHARPRPHAALIAPRACTKPANSSEVLLQNSRQSSRVTASFNFSTDVNLLLL